MKTGSAVRQLLIAYAGLWALLDLVAALPGTNPSFSSTWGVLASVAVQCLLIWRLSLGSAGAWGVGLLMALSTVAFLILQAAPFGVPVTLIVVVCLSQAGVLLTPPLRRLVWRPTPPSSA